MHIARYPEPVPLDRIAWEAETRQQSNKHIGGNLWLPTKTANAIIISVRQVLTDTLPMMVGQHHTVDSQVRQTTLPTRSLQERGSVADSTVGIVQDVAEITASIAAQHGAATDLSQETGK